MEANMAKEVYARKFIELEEMIEKIHEGQLSLNITLVRSMIIMSYEQ